MRIFDRAALILLAGSLSACGSVTDSAPSGKEQRISCRIGVDAAFAEKCSVEWQDDENFLIRHDDGGFRRFMLSADGMTISVADGAEKLTIESEKNGAVSMTIGDEAYRIDPQTFRR